MNRNLPRVAAAAILLVLIAAGCTSSGSTAATPTTIVAPVTSLPPAGSTITTAPAATPSASHTARYPSAWILPDRKLSPGAVQPGYGIRDICPHVNPALEAMRPSTAEKEAVYRAYGISVHPTGKYEIDHVDAVELLGLVGAPPGNPTLNLYPELNDTPDPAMIRKYHLTPSFIHNSKDILEDVLHQKVCSGMVPLVTAQKAMATDWRQAYAAYVGKPPA